MKEKGSQAEQNEKKNLAKRIDAIGKFKDQWVCLYNLVQPLNRGGFEIIPSQPILDYVSKNQKNYQELRVWLLQTYPKIRSDIRKYGGSTRIIERGPGNIIYSMDDYQPFTDIFIKVPDLSTLVGKRFLPEEFNQTWNIGYNLLNVTYGALRHALEIGGEDKLPSEMRHADQIVQILTAIERVLRRSFKQTPKNETEIQDHLETIIATLNLKFHRDRDRFSYSSKSYQPDFIFSEIGTVVEVKFCDTKDKEKQIIAEINDDIVAYNTKYSNQIFVIYDLGIIRDEKGFIDDIEKNPNVIVRIIKH